MSLALRMLPVADGSDSGGSLRNPAAYCNVFGLRSSSAACLRKQRTSFMPTPSVAGPLARTVSDLAMLLSIQAGYDPRVPLSNRQDPGVFAGSLKRDFKGVRIAWPGDFGGYLPFEPGVLDLCKIGAEEFRNARLRGRRGKARLSAGKALGRLGEIARNAEQRVSEEPITPIRPNAN